MTSLSLLIWVYITLGRGLFWRIRSVPSNSKSSSRVVAVIPARNEADTVALAVHSLRSQVETVMVVDDNSTDLTAYSAQNAGATVIEGSPLPEGWTGKLWALEQGLARALPLRPDYILFADADIEHDADSISSLVAYAVFHGSDLASYMVRLKTATFAEKLLIPAFVYFFFLLYPPLFQRGAAGGCILIRPQMLTEIGGLSTIRNALIDDCALARQVKRHGGKVSLQLTGSSRSLRSYGGFAGVGRMISRSAFNQLDHSYLALLGTLAGLALTYIVPIAALLRGRGRNRMMGATACGLMAFTYAPFVRHYRQPLIAVMLLPIAAVFYAGATVHSAAQYFLKRGGAWKGRLQDI